MPVAKSRRLGIRVLLSALAAAVFLFGYQWGNRSDESPDALSKVEALLIRPPLQAPDFRLQEPSGRVFDRATLSTDWTLLALGDLSQPDGRQAISGLIELYNRVSNREPLYRHLRLVLVSTGDSPSTGLDLARLTPALHVLAGEPSEIARLTQALGLSNAGGGTVLVFAPGGYLVALLDDHRDRASWASDLAALYQHADSLLPENP
jgi:hypothetical protein